MSTASPSTHPLDRWRDRALLLTVALFTAGASLPGIVLLLGIAGVEVVGGRWRWYPTRLDRPVAAFVAAAVLSALFSEWREFALPMAVLLTLTVALAVRSATGYAMGGPDRLLLLLLVWVAGGAAAALLGLLRALPATPAVVPLADMPLRHDNALAMTLALAAVLALGAAGAPGARRRWAFGAALAVILPALLLTLSRAGWLAAIAGFLVLALAGPSRRVRQGIAIFLGVLVLAGAAAAVQWPALARRAASIVDLEANRNRLLLWRTAWRIAVDHPVLGVGFGAFGPAYLRYRPPDFLEPTAGFPHNIVLHFAAETGLAGLVGFLAVCAVALAAAGRWRGRAPPASTDRAAAVALLAGLVALLTNQLFDGAAISVHGGFGLFVLLALAATGGRHTRRGTA